MRALLSLDDIALALDFLNNGNKWDKEDKGVGGEGDEVKNSGESKSYGAEVEKRDSVFDSSARNNSTEENDNIVNEDLIENKNNNKYVEELLSTIEKLKGELKDKENELDNISIVLKRNGVEIKDIGSIIYERDSLKNKVVGIESERDRYRNEASSLKERVESYSNEVARINGLVSNKNEEMSKLSEKVAERESMIKAKDMLMEKQESIEVALREEIKSLKEELRAERANADGRVDRQREREDKLRDEMYRSNKELELKLEQALNKISELEDVHNKQQVLKVESMHDKEQSEGVEKDKGVERVKEGKKEKEDSKNNDRLERQKLYDGMGTEKLFNHVRKFLLAKGISDETIDRSIIDREFKERNINKLISQSYIIAIGNNRVTIGR